MTKSRTPAFRQVSWTIRQRLTLLLTCSMRTRRRAMRRFAAVCPRVRARPHGFRVGVMSSTWSNVHARKPRSWSNRLPAGKGYGVTSAIRLSWILPAGASRWGSAFPAWAKCRWWWILRTSRCWAAMSSWAQTGWTGAPPKLACTANGSRQTRSIRTVRVR
jgi:hypothetical protein